MKNLTSTIKFLTGSLLFFLPFQTIWLYQENFLNGSKWQYGTLGFYATEIILWLSAILFMVWFIKQKKLRVTSYELRVTSDRLFILYCLLFTVYCLLSAFWAINADIAYQHGLRIMEAMILFIILLLGPLDFKTSAIYLIAGAGIQSILGIWQFLTQSTFTFKWLGLVSHPVYEAGTAIAANSSGRWLRAYGAFPHPNILGGYLVITLIVTLLLFSKEKKQNLLSLISYFLLLTIQISALFFTFSRSAWLALVVFTVSSIVYQVSCIKKIKKYQPDNQYYGLRFTVYGLLLILILSLIYLPLLQTRFSQTSPNEIISTEERVSGIEESTKIIYANPIFGVGAGNYTLATYMLDKTRPGWEYQPVHNIFLLILAELGIFGIIILSILIIYYIKTFGVNTSKRVLILAFPLIFLLLLDHYLWSSYSGLLIFSLFLALSTKFYLKED